MNPRLAGSLALFGVWVLITVLGGQVLTGGHGTLTDAVKNGPGWHFAGAAALLLAAVAWQRWRDVGLAQAATGRGWLLAWLPGLYIVGGLVLAWALGFPPAGVVLWVLVNTCLVGLSEELMFRGVLLQAFRHTVSIGPAVVLTSLAFGAVHSLNVFLTGDLRSALIQSVAAMVSGLLFIALRLRTASLWPPIVVHGLWDFAAFTVALSRSSATAGDSASPTGWMTLAPVLLVLPNGLYGLWLMRRIGKSHAHPND
jgi:membrane protease YdiL (CAAX protease family)